MVDYDWTAFVLDEQTVSTSVLLSKAELDGGFKVFKTLYLYLGKRSNLTIIFFRWVEMNLLGTVETSKLFI